MAEAKTQKNNASVKTFIENLEHPTRRDDAQQLLILFEKVTGEKAKMWGTAIVGFGSYRYRYASGKEGEWMRTGFSPRKSNMSLYIMDGFSQYETLLARLGKHKVGKSCLTINRLADVEMNILEQLISHSFHQSRLGEEKNNSAGD